DAEAIEHAKVIFWAGPSMETFLDKPIDTLGEGAKVVALGDADGLNRLKFREGGPFEAHDHGHEGHDHGHDDKKHDHAAEASEAGHDHDHGHGEYDLHFWLDPQNGKVLA
ncbi:zinc ABC transporter substrate-binding protein, partial [Bacillus safensis]|nr:zinc ABC transporter substrate-binding protein [Bacillus safensis]